MDAFAFSNIDEIILQDIQSVEQKQNLYTRFYISGRDIAAFFTDSGSDCQNCSLVLPKHGMRPPAEGDNCSSLIDRCGMEVLVDQVSFS